MSDHKFSIIEENGQQKLLFNGNTLFFDGCFCDTHNLSLGIDYVRNFTEGLIAEKFSNSVEYKNYLAKYTLNDNTQYTNKYLNGTVNPTNPNYQISQLSAGSGLTLHPVNSSTGIFEFSGCQKFTGPSYEETNFSNAFSAGKYFSFSINTTGQMYFDPHAFRFSFGCNASGGTTTLRGPCKFRWYFKSGNFSNRFSDWTMFDHTELSLVHTNYGDEEYTHGGYHGFTIDMDALTAFNTFATTANKCNFIMIPLLVNNDNAPYCGFGKTSNTYPYQNAVYLAGDYKSTAYIQRKGIKQAQGGYNLGMYIIPRIYKYDFSDEDWKMVYSMLSADVPYYNADVVDNQTKKLSIDLNLDTQGSNLFRCDIVPASWDYQEQYYILSSIELTTSIAYHEGNTSYCNKTSAFHFNPEILSNASTGTSANFSQSHSVYSSLCLELDSVSSNFSFYLSVEECYGDCHLWSEDQFPMEL